MALPSVVFTKPPVPKGNVGVIRAWFGACAHLLFQHSLAHPNLSSELRVTYGTVGPQIRYGGDSTNGYDFDLTAENDDWCKHLYQFGHEACHVLAQYRQNQHCNQWFEESLCEAASLYSLKVIAMMGAQGQGPCVNLWSGSTPYHQCLDQYANQLILDPALQYGSAKMQQWFREVEPILRNNPYCRCLNGVVANKVLPMFMAKPSNWAAVEFLNTTPCSTGHDSFSEYLNN
jgi:hypothetical protein